MLSIRQVTTDIQNKYVLVSVLLENHGETLVRPGTMFGRQVSREGPARVVEFRNSNNILPGSTARVSQLLAAVSELEFTAYRQSDGVTVPFSGGIVRRLSFFRTVSEATGQWWNDVFLPRYRSVAVSLASLRDEATLRFAEAQKRRKYRDREERHAWASVDARILQLWHEVLLPRSKSLARVAATEIQRRIESYRIRRSLRER